MTCKYHKPIFKSTIDHKPPVQLLIILVHTYMVSISKSYTVLFSNNSIHEVFRKHNF